jgi:hypothetical protein
VPPPSPWPYVGAALALAAALVLAGRTRRWPLVLFVTLAVLVGTAVVAVAGEWSANTLSFASRVGEHVYVFAGVALGIAAIVHLVVRRGRAYDATPLALLAGVALLLASGLSSLPMLAHSVLPTKLAEGLVRVLVTLTIGTGAAAIVIAATHLRRPFERRGGDQESSTTSAILRSMYAEK